MNIKKQEIIFQSFLGIRGSFYRSAINLILLPYKAVLYCKAIITTIYRMFFSKKHLLEWVTAADAEKMLGKDFKSYAREMISSSIIGFLVILSTLLYNPLTLAKATTLFFIWYSAPFVSYLISKNVQKENFKIRESERDVLIDVSKRTWNYFENNMNEGNNFLPPDNLQENRKIKLTGHTSSTNIGLGLLAIVSARDLGFITNEEMIAKLEQTINTINALEKWNGHLYNWYNIKTLEPIKPMFVSTVDSGNFVRIFICG